ncbi:unnamed protein product [Clonostachys rosea]|uniref:Uncharacterized protein n=1 Tax=Bionectria ochroleuca TaxID=29856 RepID=A0ABY6UI37_BIOOC|nr:unnamed protein product [Clonostachys rosea]
MIPTKQLSLAGLLWFGLANQGLALEIDQTSGDLTLVKRDPLPSGNLKVALAPGQKLLKTTRDMKVALAPGQRMPKIKHHHYSKRDEEGLEIRQPILPPGRHRSSFGGQMSRGGRRPRDVEECDIDIEARDYKAFHGGHRAGRRHAPRDVDELNERDLEERKISAKGVAKGIGKVAKGALGLLFRDIDERDTNELDLEARSPIFLPGKHRFDLTANRPRDLEVRRRKSGYLRTPRDLETRARRHGGALRQGGSGSHHHQTRDIEELEERDIEEIELEAPGVAASHVIWRLELAAAEEAVVMDDTQASES